VQATAYGVRSHLAPAPGDAAIALAGVRAERAVAGAVGMVSVSTAKVRLTAWRHHMRSTAVLDGSERSSTLRTVRCHGEPSKTKFGVRDTKRGGEEKTFHMSDRIKIGRYLQSL
jgi:hypothetical protein